MACTALLSILLALVTPSAGGRVVRLGVLSLLSPTAVEIVSPDRTLELPDGTPLAAGERLRVELSGETLVASTDSGGRWRGRELTLGGAGVRLDLEVIGRERRHRSFEGRLEVAPAGGRLRLVAVVELEALVASTVASELAEVEEPAALEAAAVTFRSYIVSSLGRHAREGFDLCDSTHCLYSQGTVPLGKPAGRAARAAAVATSGLVLWRQGHIVVGYCTACCGGRTTTPALLWGLRDDGDAASVRCDRCRDSRYYRWQREASTAEIHRVLEELVGRPVDAASDVRVTGAREGLGGHLVVGTGGAGPGEARLSVDEFRMQVGRRLGWDALPSPRFTVERTATGYRFRGSGFGHGIGLCVAGAVARARAGASRDALLRTYFPRASVGRLPDRLR